MTALHQYMITRRLLSTLLILACLTAGIGYSQQPATSFLEMKSLPDGHYLVDLQLDGKTRWLNFEIKSDTARCVSSDDPKLKGLRGKFQAVGNGVFFVFFQNEHYRASQHWVFRQDGSVTVKELPDRGEVQHAIRVKDDSIKPPKR